MRRRETVWGAVLVLLGLLFLLNQLGILRVSVWAVFVPLLIIWAGLRVLLTAGRDGTPAEAEALTIPLEGASEARIEIKHGAGRLHVLDGATGGALLSGTFGGGVASRVEREGTRLRAELSVPDQAMTRMVFPWNWSASSGLDWRVLLNPEVPVELRLQVGANDAHIDLRNLRVTRLAVGTGVSNTRLILPAEAGYTTASVKGGVASTVIEIPAGVAARIRAPGGFSSVRLDPQRFVRRDGIYESENYAAAPNRVDLDVEVGVGSVEVRYA
ncbi:MAG: LiaF transmembrane domain-containing protein [Anaerolineae bacterium]